MKPRFVFNLTELSQSLAIIVYATKLAMRTKWLFWADVST
ncbi:hypothetical protein GFS31_38210 [Leptolyngbya sp. BL0902]|nr:hypothetical protein GFS31_38210 [Leptolyngbya sp. BL0902]